jgi:tetratricopeptide (TPR) repeat protein
LDRISDSIINEAKIISRTSRESSLTLHIAAKEYGLSNYAESAELLEQYLKRFPFDSVAQILLCKNYAQLGKYRQAVKLLREATEVIHSPKTYDFYLKEIEAIQHREKKDFLTEESIELKIPGEQIESSSAEVDQSKITPQSLVSETLAEIYVSQGEYKEAINIYEKLIERKPENKEKYLQSIEELKSRPQH